MNKEELDIREVCNNKNGCKNIKINALEVQR